MHPVARKFCVVVPPYLRKTRRNTKQCCLYCDFPFPSIQPFACCLVQTVIFSNFSNPCFLTWGPKIPSKSYNHKKMCEFQHKYIGLDSNLIKVAVSLPRGWWFESQARVILVRLVRVIFNNPIACLLLSVFFFWNLFEVGICQPLFHC